MASDGAGASAKEADLRAHFEDLLNKAVRLKEFAIKNGYEVDPKTIKTLNELSWAYVTKRAPTQSSNLVADSTKPDGTTAVAAPKRTPAESPNLAVDSTKLDGAIAELTAVTFPTTIDLPPESETEEYTQFKRRLLVIASVALLIAFVGFGWTAASAANSGWLAVGNSILAVSLGLLGAVTYSLFNVLRVVPAQAFNPKDAYFNYARLLLGVLLGWVFYFTFSMDAFRQLHDYLQPHDNLKNQTPVPKAEAFKLLVPFVAGYSTKFVVGVLERAIAALEVSLGIEEKRDVRAKRILSRRASP